MCFGGEPGDLTSIKGIVNESIHLRGRGLVQLGLLFLVATPIARVVFSIVGFIRQRDWLDVDHHRGVVCSCRFTASSAAERTERVGACRSLPARRDSSSHLRVRFRIRSDRLHYEPTRRPIQFWRRTNVGPTCTV